MSYFASSALQTALYKALMGASSITDMIGKNLFDAPPSGDLPDLYVLLGEERVLDRSSATNTAAMHEFTLSVYSTKAGFLSAKTLAAKICEVLSDGLVLSRGGGDLISLSFVSARASRGAINQRRQIHLLFRAYISE